MAAYILVCENSSAGLSSQLPLEVAFCKKSNKLPTKICLKNIKFISFLNKLNKKLIR
ncbi:palindromic element RPE1 domain-containing protein [Rickettsia sibirica]|nr:palindromic element RPE1 domain-containing protein [Rickettsia sibirica]